MDTENAILVRRAIAADEPALIEILYNTFENTWRPNITDSAAEAYCHEDRPERYVADRGRGFLVAVRSGALVGFVDWDGDFVNALHVHSNHARSGVGRALMDKAEAEISATGFSSTRLETDTFNTTSQAFYRARGYVEAARYADAEWNSNLTTILFVKPLV